MDHWLAVLYYFSAWEQTCIGNLTGDNSVLIFVRTRGGKKCVIPTLLVPCYTMSQHSLSFTLVNLVILLLYGSGNV